MKKLRVCLALILMSVQIATIFAQDVIQLKNGDEIMGKVHSISSSEITYKHANAPDGPLRVISIDKVLFVKYENGEKEIFSTNLTSDSPLSLTSNSNESVPLISEENEMVLEAEKRY